MKHRSRISRMLTWVIYYGAKYALLGPSSKKLKKKTQKTSLYFSKRNFLALILKNFKEGKPSQKNSLYFSKWNFLALIIKIWMNGNPEKNSLYFGKSNFLALILKNFRKYKPLKSFLYFGKWNLSVHPQEISYISWNGNPKRLIFPETETSKKFLYFRKYNFLVLQEVTS